jgi:hypothetical protein
MGMPYELTVTQHVAAEVAHRVLLPVLAVHHLVPVVDGHRAIRESPLSASRLNTSVSGL